MKITAKQLRKIIEEEISLSKSGDSQRFLHGADEGHPMDDEGYMVKSRMVTVKQIAEDICGLLESGDQLPGWVQDLIATAHSDLQHVHNYLMGDEKLRSYKMGHGHSAIPMGESRNRRLNESHKPITKEEMDAWMRGDWGFISEDNE
jgi:hypothetical protein